MAKFWNLFRFDGRANRAAYWRIVLATIAVLILCVGIPVYVLSGDDKPDAALQYQAADPLKFVLIMLALIALLIGILVLLATMVRRLHDRNKSAWWILIFTVAPAILDNLLQAQVGEELPQTPLQWALFAVASGLSIWGFVEIGCLRGTRGANRYGPDPLEKSAA